VRRGNEISELKELALAMAKKKLMKLMNVFVTVDHSFYTTLPYSNFPGSDVIGRELSSDSRGERAQILALVDRNQK
jgi:hypothetical protein